MLYGATVIAFTLLIWYEVICYLLQHSLAPNPRCWTPFGVQLILHVLSFVRRAGDYMSVEPHSDNDCCMSDGGCFSRRTSTGRSTFSGSPPESRLLPAPLRTAMATLPVPHLKDHVQAKKQEKRTFSRVHGVCNPCKLAKIKVRRWLIRQ